MIEINCDNCERPFEVADDLAGGKTPCPLCGDINRVPAAGRPSRTEPVARAKGEGTAGREEKEVCVVRPAMFRAHPLRFLLILLVFAGGIALAVASAMKAWGWVLWVGVVIAVAAVGWYALWWLTSRLWIRVVISNKRTVRHEGIIRRHSTEVLHDHVRSVDINQNFLQRMLNVGYIGIDSAGQDGIEIEIRDIPGPYEVKQIIDKYRKM